MEGRKISIEVIRAAKKGDSEAMQSIIRHYDPFIRSLVSTTCYDSAGGSYTTVDELLRDRIMTKLMIQIFYKYEIGRKTMQNDDATNRRPRLDAYPDFHG